MKQTILIFFLLSVINFVIKGQVKFVDGLAVPDNYITEPADQQQLVKAPFINSDSSRSFDIIKPDFMVNELAGKGGADQYAPNIAVDGKGNYALVWQDFRNGLKEIYAQFYNKNNEKIGNNVLVSDQPNNWNSQPFIAGNPKGGFIITWAQDNYQILARMYTTEGTPSGTAFQVNTGLLNNTNHPSIAVNNSGHFMIQWSAESIYRYKLFYKIFDEHGQALTNDMEIFDNELSLSSQGWENCAATDNSGNFVVVWSSYLNDNSRIFFQIINSKGEKSGNNTLLSDISDIRKHWFPMITSTDDGYYFIAWSSDPGFRVKGGVSAKILNINNIHISEQLEIMQSDYTSYPPPRIAADQKNGFIIIYGDKLSYKLIAKDGQLSDEGEIKIVTPDSGFIGLSNLSFHSANIYTALSFNYMNEHDIYSQRYQNNFSPVNSIFKVNDDLFSSWQNTPTVYFNNSGESIVLWTDLRNGRSDLFAQVYDKDFNRAGGNFMISDVDGGQFRVVNSLSDGTFVIAFSNDPYYDYHALYFQKVSPSGEKIGSNDRITTSNDPCEVYMNINETDEIFLCWYSIYHPVHTVYFRKFNQYLSPISPEKVITTQRNGFSPFGFSLSINKKFNILTTWMNRNYSTYQLGNTIYGLIYNQDGKAISDTIIVKKLGTNIEEYYTYNQLDDNNNYIVLMNDDTRLYAKRYYFTDKEYTFENSWPARPYYYHIPQMINFENHKSLFTWVEGDEVNAAYLDDNSRHYSTNIVHTLEPLNVLFTEARNAYHAGVFDDELFFTYESRKNVGTGYDIWANVQKADQINFGKETFFPPADDDVLYSNYPNPFNSSTTIAYEILAYHKVRLAIYDILGREVKVLVNQDQEKGLYQFEFDASDLASGIYFCRLDAFRSITKKMIVIK